MVRSAPQRDRYSMYHYGAVFCARQYMKEVFVIPGGEEVWMLFSHAFDAAQIGRLVAGT